QRKHQPEDLGPAHSMPDGASSRVPVRTIAPLQDPRAADRTTRPPPPDEPPSPAVPPEDRRRLHQHQMAAPVGAETLDQHPEQPVALAEPWAPLGPERDGQLLAEAQVLQCEVALAAEEGAQHADSEAQPLEPGRRMPAGASVTLTDVLLAPHTPRSAARRRGRTVDGGTGRPEGARAPPSPQLMAGSGNSPGLGGLGKRVQGDASCL